ncbi:dimethylaniline monooxygenase [n-oxide-forming] [Plakobranchus ocellatus]|uniref:Flavin-containing monooxygenase n=1 Tax=Plakobranchus ocellatus TaxID=259542 RepID=A0AAV3YZ13_9GAST|nr:dimethylaniline monooxygenase [n-oxide-forming] [Plakobranchus ocellatus]
MASSSLRVAIVGAGACGLTAIKCCLDEGITPVCFERTDHKGGLWHYTDQPFEGQACVMKSTVINTSKEMMCYSDYPIPAHFPNYMHNSQVLEYFHQYVEHFNLEQHIQYLIEVTSIKRADSFAKTGQWEICYRNHSTGKVSSELFDGVLICTGHHAEKYVPEFPGLKNFQGKVLHAHDYRVPTGYEDKKVLIIGMGNSGGDCAVELSRVAKQVLLSTRQGSWVWNRVSDNGLPVDLLGLRRPFQYLLKYFSGLLGKLSEYKINRRFNHDLYSLRPAYGIWAQHPMVNDDLPNRIISGSVRIKDNVKCFTTDGAEFVDGTRENDIDAIILATGYTFGFPFLDKKVLEVKENRMELYKLMFPPDLEKQTLAVIGCFQPLGAVMPIAEMQCRLATRVIKGTTKLPAWGEMWNDIRRREAEMAQRYVASRRHTIQVDYMVFMDELAQLVGCYPDFFCLFKRDPVFAMKVFFGPIYPYTYRLCGPGQWSGAREAILTAWDRVKTPLQTRPLPAAFNNKFSHLHQCNNGWSHDTCTESPSNSSINNCSGNRDRSVDSHNGSKITVASIDHSSISRSSNNHDSRSNSNNSYSGFKNHGNLVQVQSCI